MRTAIEIVLAAYGLFAFWMLFVCVRDHEDPKERAAWFLFFVLLGFLAAPIYFFVCYWPRRHRMLAVAPKPLASNEKHA